MPQDKDENKQGLFESLLGLSKAQGIKPDPRELYRKWYESIPRPVTWLADLITGGATNPDFEPGPADVVSAAMPIAGITKAAGPQYIKGVRSLAQTIKPTEDIGRYALKAQVVDRIKSLYQLGTLLPSTSNWAGSTSEDLIRAFGGDQDAALRWARMWGATSPNTSVPVNTRESVSALAHALENPGELFTVPMAQNLPDAKITMAPAKVPNLNRALAGEPLSGDKVEAMAAFMAGEPRIPIDVHALYAAGSHADKFQADIPALRAAMTRAEGLPARSTARIKSLSETDIYLRYEDALKRTLKEIEPKRSVNQVFAEMWEGARAHKGLKPQGGPIDILRKKGLLEAGAMLDPDRLRAALRSQGWTAGAIAGFMAALPESGDSKP